MTYRSAAPQRVTREKRIRGRERTVAVKTMGTMLEQPSPRGRHRAVLPNTPPFTICPVHRMGTCCRVRAIAMMSVIMITRKVTRVMSSTVFTGIIVLLPHIRAP